MHLNDFEEFKSQAQNPPPEALSRAILEQVTSDLNPTSWLVFAKLSLIQAVVGLATLLFCPQFGLSPLGSTGFVPLLMRFGEFPCMFSCGCLFLGSSALVASFVLSRDEIRVLRRKELLQISAVSLISVAAFVCTGAEMVLSIALFWLIGAVVGGIGFLELGLKLRYKENLL